MDCRIESLHPLDDASARAATGHTPAEWFARLETGGFGARTRRDTVAHLYSDLKVPDWWAVTLAVEYEGQRGQRNKKDGLLEGYGICSTKTIGAPLDSLWTAWVEPAQLSKWLGGKNKANVEDGGSYSNADGDSAKYLRVRPLKDLRFTWSNPQLSSDTLVDVLFAAKGDAKSHVTVNHTRIQTRAEADGLRAGWADALDKLKALLEG